MWERVLATDSQLVDAAYRVVSSHSKKWNSSAEFRLWLQGHDDYVIYRKFEKFALVLVFRRESDGRWRGIGAGTDAGYSIEALQACLDGAIAFLREQGAAELFVQLRERLRKTADEAAVRFVLGLARANAAVAGIREQRVAGHREFTLTLAAS